MIKFNLGVLMAQHRQRTGQRLSYRLLSAATGVNKNSLNSIVANKSKRVDLSTLNALCDFFDCDVSALLIRIPETEDKEAKQILRGVPA
jgi:putative transcriptional regulator